MPLGNDSVIFKIREMKTINHISNCKILEVMLTVNNDVNLSDTKARILSGLRLIPWLMLSPGNQQHQIPTFDVDMFDMQ